MNELQSVARALSHTCSAFCLPAPSGLDSSSPDIKRVSYGIQQAVDALHTHVTTLSGQHERLKQRLYAAEEEAKSKARQLAGALSEDRETHRSVQELQTRVQVRAHCELTARVWCAHGTRVCARVL